MSSKVWRVEQWELSVRATQRRRMVAMVAAVLTLAIVMVGSTLLVLDRQQGLLGEPEDVFSPVKAGVRWSVVSFETMTELPGEPPGPETYHAPGVTFVVTVVRQEFVAQTDAGMCELQLGKGDKRWDLTTEDLSALGGVFSPLQPDESMCMDAYATPTPGPGTAQDFGAIFIVPTSEVEGVRPVVELTDTERQHVSSLWL